MRKTKPVKLKKMIAGWIGLFALLASAGASEKPNIVFILVDDLGYADLGIHGSGDVQTPHIDRLARQGVICTDAYVTAPQCAPSRAGIMTGRFQASFGFETNFGKAFDPIAEELGWGVPEQIPMFPDYLKKQGYVSAAIGKWHLGYTEEHNPVNRGFDEFVGFLHGGGYFLNEKWGIPILRGTERVMNPEPSYLTDFLTHEAIDFMERHKEQPFFVYLAHFAPHVPLHAPKAYLKKFSHVANKNRRTFLAMMACLDDGVGRVMDYLDRSGLSDNTLVFFVSDNGGPTGDNPEAGENTSKNDPFAGVKGDLLEGGLRVPFIVRWPDRIKPGSVYRGPVSTLDILPTALAVSGGGVDPSLHGIDLTPYLTGSRPPALERSLFWRYGPQKAMRSGAYKLYIPYPGVTEVYNIRSTPYEHPSVQIPEESDVRENMQAHLDNWTMTLAEPHWKMYFPAAVLRSLERHNYAGYESFLEQRGALGEKKFKWAVTKQIYQDSFGFEMDSPARIQQQIDKGNISSLKQ